MVQTRILMDFSSFGHAKARHRGSRRLVLTQNIGWSTYFVLEFFGFQANQVLKSLVQTEDFRGKHKGYRRLQKQFQPQDTYLYK